MRIIRPQQLAVLKNGYQIGQECHMGISVIAGFYLSRPSHFVTEAQIWQAWKSAPTSFHVLDGAEPKPYAEFLLAGHAGIGEEVTALDVIAHVGPLTRRWRVEGESNKAGMMTKPFTRMPMDHTQSWGGKGCKDNPLGRGYNDNRHPTLMTMNIDGSAMVCSPLAAPTPLPPDFQVRKSYIDDVAGAMTDKHYLETCFPGLPPSIDRRYFQTAAPQQWLKKAEWPDDVPFELHGFRAGYDVLAGEFPAVRARAFAWRNGQPEPEEVLLLRKTLWLLPDNDIGLIVFTGHLSLSHLFEEPLETLLVALDPAAALRDEAHYCGAYTRRTQEGAPPFEFLNDPDLMPEGMALNVIRDLSDHPDSKRYSALPLAKVDAARFYRDLQETIELYRQRQKQRESGESDKAGAENPVLPALSDELGENWLRQGENEAENMTFSGTDFSAHTLQNKQFRYCTFNNCSFPGTCLQDCTFEFCQFIYCSFSKATFKNVTLKSCFVRNSRLQEALIERGVWEKVTVESSGFQMSRFNGCIWNHNVIMQGDFSQCSFDDSSLNHGFFSGTTLSDATFHQGNVISCVFEKCASQGTAFNGCALEKDSFVGGSWQKCSFIACQIESVTTGLGISLSGTHFEQCSMSKVGFTKADLRDSRFAHCTLLETCCDMANLEQANVTHCDMAGLRLKDAVLIHSSWNGVSLQQGMLYNADLRDATFRGCNFVGANLAMINQNVMTRFERCLMEQTHWIPRRYRATA